MAAHVHIAMTVDDNINLARRLVVAGMFLFTLGLAAFVAVGDEPTAPDGQSAHSGKPFSDLLGSWIWDSKTFDGQTCQCWRAFDIAPDQQVSNARLLMTADNEFN